MVNEPELIDGAVEILKLVRELGYEIIIITNQYIINENFITLEQYHSFTNSLMNLLTMEGIEVLDIFYCRHARWENCACIKPNGGMIKEALVKYPAIDLKKSFVIGDSQVDIELAHRLNMRGYGININEKPRFPTVTYINSIKELSQLLCMDH
ncbi:HAD-IIIA family hydrolase [Solibacillus sp. CAU 1738]|uniref:HAD-IIIA family hydrolase n=1 Tax=Solibacillus sp. CAU 1738 TaxID=3140363 RepID=UPI0032609418